MNEFCSYHGAKWMKNLVPVNQRDFPPCWPERMQVTGEWFWAGLSFASWAPFPSVPLSPCPIKCCWDRDRYLLLMNEYRIGEMADKRDILTKIFTINNFLSYYQYNVSHFPHWGIWLHPSTVFSLDYYYRIRYKILKSSSLCQSPSMANEYYIKVEFKYEMLFFWFLFVLKHIELADLVIEKLYTLRNKTLFFDDSGILELYFYICDNHFV